MVTFFGAVLFSLIVFSRADLPDPGLFAELTSVDYLWDANHTFSEYLSQVCNGVLGAAVIFIM
jgi:hypothetical protein